MKFLFVFLLTVSSSLAFAGQVLVGAGANMNFQMATSGRSYEMKTPIALRAGYRFSFMDVITEYSYLKSSSGNDLVSIEQANHELLVWGRKTFGLTRVFLPLVALGAGGHQTNVSTRFGSQTQSEAGSVEPVGAAAGGFEIRIGQNTSWTLEGRATFADAYSPNPLLGLASYLYVLF